MDFKFFDNTGAQKTSSSAGTHAGTHINGAGDQIDGDELHVSWNPSIYVPDATPAEATDVDSLTAHLKGADDMLDQLGADHNGAKPISVTLQADTGAMSQVANDSWKRDSGSAWDAQVYSNEGHRNACYLRFRTNSVAGSRRFMIGLNTDPATDANYTSIDHCFYVNATDILIYEGGSSKGSHGTATTSTNFEIQYTGTSIIYMLDGIVVRSVPVAMGTSLWYMDSSFFDPNAQVNDVRFGPMAQPAMSPAQMATCSISDTAGTYTNAATQGVDFTGGVIEADTDGMADLANDRIVINTDGVYMVGGQMEVTYGGTYLAAVYVYINGVFTLFQQAGTQAGFARLNCHGILNLVSGDLITLLMYQNSGTTRTAGPRKLHATMLYPT